MNPCNFVPMKVDGEYFEKATLFGCETIIPYV